MKPLVGSYALIGCALSTRVILAPPHFSRSSEFMIVSSSSAAPRPLGPPPTMRMLPSEATRERESADWRRVNGLQPSGAASLPETPSGEV